MKATEAYVGKVFKRAKKYKGLDTTRTQIASTRPERRKSDRIWDSLALENDVNRRSSTHFEPKDLPRYDFTQQERERMSQRLASLAKHNAKRKPREMPVSKPLGRKRLAQMDYPSRLELVRQWDSF
jgi:hypothetical protein